MNTDDMPYFTCRGCGRGIHFDLNRMRQAAFGDVAAYLEVKASNFPEDDGLVTAALDVRMMADGTFDPAEAVTDGIRDEAIRRLALSLDLPLWLLDPQKYPQPWRSKAAARLRRFWWRVTFR